MPERARRQGGCAPDHWRRGRGSRRAHLRARAGALRRGEGRGRGRTPVLSGPGPLSPIRWKRGETEYVLSWIPFGGYVKMATAEDDEHGALSAIEGGAARESFPPEKLF